MFEYCTPASLEEALGLLTAHPGQARIIAGGTDLLPDLRKGNKHPQFLVNIMRLPGLDQIKVDANFVEVSAAVTFANIKEHPFFKRHIHALAEAAASVGAPSVQTAATWVGNLVNAMPAADGAIVALALEAEVRVVDQNKSVWQPVETLFLGPGKSAIDSSCQIITHLRFPVPSGAWGTAWQRVGRRTALTLPIINCAVKVVLDGERIQRAIVALGPVAPWPFRAKETEAFLAGKLPIPDVLAEAGKIAQRESNPRSNELRASRAYRLAIIPVLIRRALISAVGRAKSLVETKDTRRWINGSAK